MCADRRFMDPTNTMTNQANDWQQQTVVQPANHLYNILQQKPETTETGQQSNPLFGISGVHGPGWALQTSTQPTDNVTQLEQQQQQQQLQQQQQQQYVLPVLYGNQWYQTAAAAALNPVQQNLVNQVQQQEFAAGEVSSQNLDDHELKRERRRLSNREAARRSRKRKQDEMKRLAINVEDLQSENERLKKQIGALQNQIQTHGEVQKKLIQKIYGMGGSINDLNIKYKFGVVEQPKLIEQPQPIDGNNINFDTIVMGSEGQVENNSPSSS